MGTRATDRLERRQLVTPVAAFVASRAVVAVAVGAVVDLRQGLAAQGFAGPWPTPPPGPLFFRALTSWDASWYSWIAAHGYFDLRGQPLAPHSTFGFFPVWPLLIRAFSETGASIAVSAAVVTFVVGAAASVALWALAAHLTDKETADRAVVLWVFFPGSIVLSLAYAEGLVVLLAASCIIALLRRRWLLAGILAGLATATHPEGFALVACCGWTAVLAVRDRREWSALLAPALSVTGVAAYFGYLYARTGDALVWYHVQRQLWGARPGFWHDTGVDLSALFVHPGNLQESVPALGLLALVGGLVAMIKWRPPAVVWVFTVVVLAEAFASTLLGARPRVLLVAFPLMIGAASVLSRERLDVAVGVSGVLLGVFTFLLLAEVVVSP